MSLFAVVITRNEEINIERCIKSLSFCDEVVVLDAQSEDKTRELATSLGAKVHVQPWAGYVQQKNRAVELATGDWVLSVDADEVVSDELRGEIQSLLSLSPAQSAFSVPRKTIHFGKWIRFGGWYPNRLVRLFRKGTGQWSGGELHEYWKTAGQVGELRGNLIHYSFKDLADQVARNNHYSTLGAIDFRRTGIRFSAVRLFTKPLSKFVETFLLKRGFLDGFPGFFISVSAAYSVFLRWAKLWELEKCDRKR